MVFYKKTDHFGTIPNWISVNLPDDTRKKEKKKNFPDLTLSSFDDPSNFLFRTSKILIVFFRFFFSLRLGIFYDPDLGLTDLQVSDLFGFFCWNWFWAKRRRFRRGQGLDIFGGTKGRAFGIYFGSEFESRKVAASMLFFFPLKGY